jgi:hypothetical protein
VCLCTLSSLYNIVVLLYEQCGAFHNTSMMFWTVWTLLIIILSCVTHAVTGDLLTAPLEDEIVVAIKAYYYFRDENGTILNANYGGTLVILESEKHNLDTVVRRFKWFKSAQVNVTMSFQVLLVSSNLRNAFLDNKLCTIDGRS